MRQLTFLIFLSSFVKIQAQDCNPFYSLREGITATYEYYDAKDKKTSSSSSTIKEVNKIPGGVEALVSMTMLDKSEKEMYKGETRVSCRNDSLFLDVGSLLNPGIAQSAGQMEISMTGSGLTIPGVLRAGMQLPDSHNEFVMGMNGTKIMTITIDITQHMVEAEEKVTTPAGVFDCYRVSYVANSKMSLIKTSTKTIQWYAKGVGVVKMENYDKKGALDSKMLLTGLK